MFNFLQKIFCKKKIHQLAEENQRLKADQKLLLHLMENLPHNVYFKDDSGHFTRINQMQAKLLGLHNPEDATGKTDFDFFTSKHAHEASIDEKIILKTGKPIVGKVEHIRSSDGTFIWVTTSKSPILDDNGKAVGIVGVTVDITDKIEAEKELKKAKNKAEESSKLKSAFLANMSHEIRTPMNGILGFSQLLKTAGTNAEEINKYVDHIDGCGNTLLGIIENIIDFSKLVSGQLSVKPETCPLNIIMDQVYHEFTVIKKDKISENLRFHIEKGVQDTNFVMETDAQRLKQVLFQLIDNAFKFTITGQITFGYQFVDHTLKFYIKDTGLGIPRDKFDIIFDSFGQIVESNSVKPKGTGLGLAISSKLIRLLGGNIWVESEPGEGSTFYFTLPYRNSVNPPSKINGHDKTSTLPDWNGKFILIAEDEELNWLFIKELLKGSNARLLWAKNGLEALEMMEQNQKVDLVLMDLKMPVLDGHEAIKIMKSNYKDTPIIAQTAHALEEEKQEILNSGCDAYLIKPLNIHKLVSVMENFMDK